MITKSITIEEDQAEFVEKTALNLSRFVQLKLKEAMDRHPDFGE